MCKLSVEKDREFINALLEGDNAAWEQMSQCVESWLINASRRHYIPEADIQDHRQEIVSKLIENNYHRLQQFSFRCRLSSWVGSVVNNYLYDHYTTEIRRVRRETGYHDIQKEFFEAKGSEDKLVENLDKTELIGKAMEQLNDGDREILKQVYWDGLMPKEISRITGERNSTVTSRLTRARNRLKEVLVMTQRVDKEGKVI